MAISELESYIDIVNRDNYHYQYPLKHTIINLASAIELLVKDCLMEEHWTLFFSDINKASVEKLESGDFVSVDFYTGIQRLKNICGIDISLNECIKLHKYRNQIVHYKLTETFENVLSNISSALFEIATFIEEETLKNLPEEAVDDFSKHIQDMKNISLNINEIIKRI